ncbi:nucleotide sugar dehydrogenase [Ceratobasidium sp. AG-I]|nr:nucleotide sugar dehydrogenase [Ceratobasidium sp. AG-I]
MAPVVKKICCIGAGDARVDAWNSEDFNLPIYEPGLEDVVREARGRNLFFSTDVDKGIQKAELIFVSVNTPTKKSGVGAGFAADLKYASIISRIAHVSHSSKTVVKKSTIPCRTAESMRTTLEANSKPSCRFDILSNPEFLAEGTAISNISGPDRVLVGSLQSENGKSACASLRDRILTVGLWSSELSKLAANAMLAQRFSSINALSVICEATGANIDEVAHAVGRDSRVGPKFLKASVSFGGSCFQKDILNLVYLSESLHLPEMNDQQKRRFSKRVVDTLFNTITGKRIAVLGFAFKADTGDTRESAAITLIQHFQQENALVNVYDPQVEDKQIWQDLQEASPTVALDKIQKQVTIHKSALEACKNAEAVVIATEWKEFTQIDWETVYKGMNKPAFVFDGRLLLDADALRKIGFKVVSIGHGERV